MARVQVFRKNTTCNNPDDIGPCCSIVPVAGPNYKFDDLALYVCEAQSCQSGSGFSGRVGFGPGSGLDFEKLSGLNRAARLSKIEVFSKR